MKINEIDYHNIKEVEFKNSMYFCDGLLTTGLKKEALIYWLKSIAIKPFNKFHLYFIRKYLGLKK